ncbi:MAG: acetate--CoA ligase family protein, partial [Rudaea sp.]
MESATGKSVPILVSAPYELRTLDAIFSPKSVAVFGVGKDGSPDAQIILSNLIEHSFKGAVFSICSDGPAIPGTRCYPTLSAVGQPVDLAVIAAPASQVPGIVGECIDAGAKGAVIVSSGFRECGSDGLDLERQVVEQARRGRIRIIGPNSHGVVNTATGLNASTVRAMPRKGGVAFVSQSGALGAAVLDWSRREQVGFSVFVSIGSMLDVGWGDLIYYLSDDASTRSILLYMESVGDARSLLSAAREVALAKPIIVLQAGATDGGRRAAASHSGSLTGDLPVLDAAFRRTGVLRVNTVGELFDMAETLGKQPRPAGPRLTIVTNSGASAVLAVDELIANGGELTRLTDRSVQALERMLPNGTNAENPVDLGDDAGPSRYAAALEIAANDENSSGMLVILTPHTG